MPGRYRPATQQNGRFLFRLPGRYAANHDFRIFIMDRVAVRADMARHIVQRRDIDNQGMSAVRTEFHVNLKRLGTEYKETTTGYH